MADFWFPCRYWDLSRTCDQHGFNDKEFRAYLAIIASWHETGLPYSTEATLRNYTKFSKKKWQNLFIKLQQILQVYEEGGETYYFHAKSLEDVSEALSLKALNRGKANARWAKERLEQAALRGAGAHAAAPAGAMLPTPTVKRDLPAGQELPPQKSPSGGNGVDPTPELGAYLRALQSFLGPRYEAYVAAQITSDEKEMRRIVDLRDSETRGDG